MPSLFSDIMHRHIDSHSYCVDISPHNVSKHTRKLGVILWFFQGHSQHKGSWELWLGKLFWRMITEFHFDSICAFRQTGSSRKQYRIPPPTLYLFLATVKLKGKNTSCQYAYISPKGSFHSTSDPENFLLNGHFLTSETDWFDNAKTLSLLSLSIYSKRNYCNPNSHW